MKPLELTKNIFCCSGEVSAEEAPTPQRKKNKAVSFKDSSLDSSFASSITLGSVDTDDDNDERSQATTTTTTTNTPTTNQTTPTGVLKKKEPTPQKKPANPPTSPTSNNDLADLFSQITMVDDEKKQPKKAATKVVSNFLHVSYPYKINVWNDHKMNQKCSVQVHLESGTLASEYKPRLEMRGSKQFLCLSHILSPAFLNDEIYEATAGELIADPKERNLMCHSHSAEIKIMREKYNRDTLGNEEDEEDRPVAALMEVELPFVCDDIFDDSIVPYENTGYNFKSLELDVDVDDYDDVRLVDDNMDDAGDDENYNEDNEMDIIFIFSIVLVKREKQAVITKTTPKKVVVRGKKFSRKSRK